MGDEKTLTLRLVV